MHPRHSLIVRHLVLGFLLSLSTLELMAQGRLVLNGATITISNSSYLVLDNPASIAITRNSGYIISEGESNLVKWNIGTTTGTYLIPWGYGSNYIPVSFTKTAGRGAGSFLFSTYHTPWLNTSLLPSGVSNFSSGAGWNNSGFANDRFWQINASGYQTKPALSSVLLTYLDAEFNAPNTNSVEGSMTAIRWNENTNTWLDYVPAATVNTTANTLTIPTIGPSDLYKWWVASYVPDRHWTATVPSNWNDPANWSYTVGGPGGATVPATIDAILFNSARNADLTLEVNATVSAMIMDPGYSGTITQGTHSLTITNGATLSGGNFAGGSGDIQVTGPLNLAGTTFTSTSGLLNLKGDFNFTGGSFIHNGGTVQFSGSTTQNLGGSAVADFNNISVTNSTANPAVSVESDHNVLGVLTLASNSVLDADGSNNTSQFKLISTSDNPTHDAAIAALPSGAQVAGNIVAQRYMSIEGVNSGRIYRYISSPVQNATVADIQQELPITGTFTGSSVCAGCRFTQSMFGYDESITTDVNGSGSNDFDDGYSDFPQTINTEVLAPGKGYATFVRGNILSSALWDVHGPINAGNVAPVSFPVSFTSSGNSTNDGWNLVGNPFPSTIDWNAASGWTKTNVTGTVYFSDNGSSNFLQYATWNGSVGTNGGSSMIAIGQGFWVKANGSGTPVLQATESVKAAGTQGTFFRTAPLQNLLRVSMTSGPVRDEAVVHFRDDATASFDAEADAWKLKNASFNLSSRITSGKLAINSMPALDCSRDIPLSVDNASVGTYSLNFSQMESFPAEVAIVLSDNFTKTTADVRTTSTYGFTVTSDTASSGANRFSIKFSVPRARSDFDLATADVCEGLNGSVTIGNSQAGATYSAMLNNEVLMTQVGNGSTITIDIPASKVHAGEDSIAIVSSVAGCSVVATKQIILGVVKKAEVVSVKDGQHCRDGQVTLTATGLVSSGVFNWYDSEISTEAISGQHASFLITPVLQKSKTYYVSTINALGCEGERKAVHAEIVQFDDVQLDVQGDKLYSSYAEGNEWFFDNMILVGATGPAIEAEKSGTYSVRVFVNGCATSASRQYTVTGLVEEFSFTAYPNPVVNEVRVEIPEASNVKGGVTVLNELGQVVGVVKLRLEAGKWTGQFDMKSQPNGLYILNAIGKNGKMELKLIKE